MITKDWRAKIVDTENNDIHSDLGRVMRELHVTHTQQKIVLLNALEAKFGPGVAEVVEEANGQAMADLYPQLFNAEERGVEDLIQALWEPLRGQGFDFSVEKTDEGVQMRCTACPWEKLFRFLGSPKWGYHLYCAADEALARRFNPEIEFRRTKTLMEGHDCCDHFYSIKK